MTTVTQRIKQITQPRGGYINPKSMKVTTFDDATSTSLDTRSENVHATTIGLTVDYLSRFLAGHDRREAFSVSLRGAEMLKESGKAERLLKQIKGLDSTSIVSACKLVGYDVVYRRGSSGYRPVEEIQPDETTIEHVEVMLKRSMAFFKWCGPITLSGFDFPGAYTSHVTNGDGDFLTQDTLWDFKVSVKPPTKDHTLQLLMYYIMGQHSTRPEFDTIVNLGVFNPRLNSAYQISLNQVPEKIVQEVSKEIIGY